MNCEHFVYFGHASSFEYLESFFLIPRKIYRLYRILDKSEFWLNSKNISNVQLTPELMQVQHWLINFQSFEILWQDTFSMEDFKLDWTILIFIRDVLPTTFAKHEYSGAEVIIVRETCRTLYKVICRIWYFIQLYYLNVHMTFTEC